MQVFISNIHGRDELNAKAAALGLKAGEINTGGRCGIPALGGNTFVVKDALKANGARWNGACKVWTFESKAALESAINALNALV